MHTSVADQNTKRPCKPVSPAPHERPGEFPAAAGLPVRTLSSALWVDQLVLITAIIVAAVALWRVQMVVRWNLASPYDLVFESPNLASINALRSGLNIYDPAVFNAPPFVFTLYTPLYHLICAALPSSANAFLTGRWVALVFMVLAVVGICRAARPRPWPIILLALSLFCLLHPVTANAGFLKNDAVALFFSVLAMLVLRNRRGNHLRLAGAALCCVLALAAKQVFVAASAACFVSLLIHQPRRDAFRFGLYYVLFAALSAAVAQIAWGNGFWFCALAAPQMPFDLAQFTAQWALMLKQPTFVLLNVFVITGVVVSFFQRQGKQLAANPFFLYFAFAEAILFATVGKPGSSTNYFIESSLAATFLLVSIGPSLSVQNFSKVAVTGLCLGAVVLEMASAKPREFAFMDAGFIAWRTQFHQRLGANAESIAAGAKPLRTLNLATASTFYDWPGETSVTDPYLYFLLWDRGVLSPEPLVRALRSQFYDVVVFRNDGVWMTSAHTDGVGVILRAVRDSYQLARSDAGFDYWTRLPLERRGQ